MTKFVRETQDRDCPKQILPPEEELKQALDSMILSPSGWRAVFAGGEENRDEAVSPAHTLLAAAAARVFAGYLKQKHPFPRVILGRDTRPTGPKIAGSMIKSFTAWGVEVLHIAEAAAPEIMAYARALGAGEKAQGFVYISASHNPIGHNGLKFGLTDGGVLPGEEALALIGDFRGVMDPSGAADGRKSRLYLEETLAAIEDRGIQDRVDLVYAETAARKKEALQSYDAFIRQVAEGAKKGPLFSVLGRALAGQPLGILADFNGSARAVSIDGDFLGALGIRFSAINAEPGAIAHRIVPEGEALIPCALALEELHGRDPAFIMGYVPDCDGDRGNIVFWDEGPKRVRALEAQEVFALSCVSELAFLVWNGELEYDIKGNALTKAAVAVNGPTSLRIERIAGAFDLPVFRSETGEANVVGLARKLREKGFLVRVLGEGSAGGTIIHPQAVRDPLSTIMALVKLLTLRSDGDKPGLYEIWCDMSGQTETYREDFTLQDIIASLPAFTTTGIYTPEARLAVKSGDQANLKKQYQKIFLEEWETKKERLRERYGITGWEAAAFTGSGEIRGLTRFEEAGRGGLKIHFLHESGRPAGAVWMRGSATEPVFRVMADAEGSDSRLERELIEWQRHLVSLADTEAAKRP
jgi:phosphoglucomutase